MKSRLESTGREDPDQEYPYLGIDRVTKEVVLFRRREEGTVVHASPSAGFVLGDRVDSVGESRYSPYRGSVVLDNDSGNG